MALGLNRHIREDDIERYSMGTIPEEEAAPIEEHLLVCDSCRERVTASDACIGLIRAAGMAQRSVPEPPPRRWGLPWGLPRLVPVLAGLAMAAILVVVGLNWLRPGQPVPAFAVKLAAARGAGAESQAPAGKPLALDPDLTGLPVAPSYKLEMVDSAGKPVWKGATPGASAPPVPAGLYFVRVYSAAGELLREYGLEVGAAGGKARN